MAIVELRWKWLGVLIPLFLISFIGYGSHFFIFRHDFSTRKQVVFELMISIIWLTYYLAICKSPGSPPKGFQYPDHRLVWSKWCKKCQSYKPERSHHCKTCKTCVLKMDHHCPWTMNCVGYENFPHFLRFLLSVEITTAFVGYHFSFKYLHLYKNMNLPAYLFDTTQLAFLILLSLLDLFVFFTISILIARVVSNQFFSGMTQIEAWEYERVESQINSKRFWKQINRNHYKIYGKNLDFARFVSSSNLLLLESTSDESYELRNLHLESDSELDFDELPLHFTIDDIIFPYDISLWANVQNCLGPWYLFWWPWSNAPHRADQNGLVFQIEPDFKELDQLGLPWPPDGGDQHVSPSDVDYFETMELSSNGHMKRVRIIDPRLKLRRNEWYNDFGEKLSDFGVDLDVEDDDNERFANTPPTNTT